MFQNRFDEFYLTICKETGGIEGLLKSFFDFMFRKTDFFYECDPGDKMGFPPGYNQQMLLAIFQKFQEEHYKRFPKKSRQDFDRKMSDYEVKKQQHKKQPVPTTQQSAQKQKNQPENTEVPELKQPKSESSGNRQDSVPIINTYNGGQNEKYGWSQQSNDVQVTIEIESTLKSKMLDVQLSSDKLSIRKKTGEVIIEGELYEKINASESVWKIQQSAGKSFITLNLEKAQDKIWSTVFKGDPEIDTSKVNNTKPLHSFDDETQGAIRKIMYEQQRKQMGLPTTEEEKQIDALKKAWDADGSPFKGQPFDPSKFNLSGSDFQPQ